MGALSYIKKGFIRLYSIENDCTPVTEFQTVSTVRNIYYLPNTDWVITCEKDSHIFSARIYFNWRTPDAPKVAYQNGSIQKISNTFGINF